MLRAISLCYNRNIERGNETLGKKKNRKESDSNSWTLLCSIGGVLHFKLKKHPSKQYTAYLHIADSTVEYCSNKQFTRFPFWLFLELKTTLSLLSHVDLIYSQIILVLLIKSHICFDFICPADFFFYIGVVSTLTQKGISFGISKYFGGIM